MSKIGQSPILLSQSVVVEITGNKAVIKGSNGQKNIILPDSLKLKKEGENIKIVRKSEDKKTKSLHGLYRQLVYDLVTGVEKPWSRRLEVVGTGYNVRAQGEDLIFKLGYSHPVIFKKVEGIQFAVEGNNKVIVTGIDKQLVGQTAYQIKILKKPDVYKGKGIRYENEKLRIKPGKKVKTTTTGAA